MKRIISIIGIISVICVTAQAQKREKYEFMRGLPVYADSLIADLTYPLAWWNSEITDFNEWRKI